MTVKGVGGGTAVAFAALVAVNVIWGLGFAFVKLALEELPPITFSALVTGLALVLLLPLALRRGLLPALYRYRGYLLLNGIMLTTSQAAFTIALKLAPAAIIALLTSLAPATIVILAILFLNERIARRGWLGITLATAGALLALGAGPGEFGADDPLAIVGGLIMFIAIISWSTFNVVTKRLVSDGASPLAVTTGTILFQWLGLLLLSPLEHATGVSVSWGFWAIFGILYMGILGTVFGFMAVGWALQRLEGSRAGAMYYLETLVGVAGAWIFLKEQPGPTFLAGALLVLGGVYLVKMAQIQTVPPAAAAPALAPKLEAATEEAVAE